MAEYYYLESNCPDSQKERRYLTPENIMVGTAILRAIIIGVTIIGLSYCFLSLVEWMPAYANYIISILIEVIYRWRLSPRAKLRKIIL